MTSPFDMYRRKVKKTVDPNAPPRPNLLSHDKTIREAQSVISRLEQENHDLRSRVERLENKLNSQTVYLERLHNHVTKGR
jgi:phage shock protein A